MKKALLCSVILLVGSVLFVAAAGEKIQIGDSKERVISILGEPNGKMKWGKEEILTYDVGDVTLVNGKVTHYKLLSDKQLARKRARPAGEQTVRKEPREEDAGRRNGRKEAVPEGEEAPREDTAPRERINFNDVHIDNVPIAPFLSEIGNKVDITRHPTYTSMPRMGGNKHIVDPFFFKRDEDKAPPYSFRQFTTTQGVQELVDWYEKEAGGGGSDFSAGGGIFRNGPVEDLAVNIGTNNARNFIYISGMKGKGEDTMIVYIFHYRKGEE